MKKRLLTITLIASLMISMILVNTISVKAGSFENPTLAEKLKEIGVFVGSDDGFELGRVATRLEGIILLIRLLGVEEEALASQEPIPFEDVPEWAFPYVSYAYHKGLSNGISATEFGSNLEMTGLQYFTFMGRALGYDDSQGDFVWNESIDFFYHMGFMAEFQKSMFLNNDFIRGYVAELTYHLLLEPMKGSKLTLGQSLINTGKLDADKAMAIGITKPLYTIKDNDGILITDTWSADYDQVAIEKSLELGYPSVYEVPETMDITSNYYRTLTFTNELKGQALYDSFTHNGFEGLNFITTTLDTNWSGMGELVSDNFIKETNYITCNEGYIYEYTYVNDYEQYYEYTNPENLMYYQVQDFLEGNINDPDSISHNLTGGQQSLQPYKPGDRPTYNPLLLTNFERLSYITLSRYNDEDILYLEKISDEGLTKQWISLRYGVILKEELFNTEGLSTRVKEGKFHQNLSVQEGTFDQPNIEYKDYTMLFYFLTYENALGSLLDSLNNTFDQSAYSFDLVSNNETAYTFHVEDYEDNGKFTKYGYVTKRTDSQGNLVELVNMYQDNLFYTIAHSMNVASAYKISTARLMMFEFEDLNLVSIVTNGTTDTYTFNNPINDRFSVSGMYEYYEYNVNEETSEIIDIRIILKDSPFSNDEVRASSYTIENFGSYDEELLILPDDYSIQNPDEGEYYDGEYPLSYFYYNEFHSEN